MTDREERLVLLVERGRREREALEDATLEIRRELERRRAQWKAASVLATGAAVVGTVAYKLFGKSSFSARLGRTASVVSLLLGLARAALKIRRFF
jgi:sirohydrochlorin ferrochelatase